MLLVKGLLRTEIGMVSILLVASALAATQYVAASAPTCTSSSP